MNLQLKNRVVFVTGGSRGIGKAVIMDLLKEGAYVGTCSRKLHELEELYASLPVEIRSRLAIQECDVRNSEEVRLAVNHTIAQFGRLDGIVANAGFGTSGRILETSAEEWISQYEMKLLSVTNLVQASISALRQSDAARIVIMNGVTANTPDPHMAAVSVSRAAVKQYAKLLATELTSDKICVNTVNIGAIGTERQMERFKKSASQLTFQEWEKEEAKRRGIGFERFGRTDEVSPAVLLLLSPLSSYITGSAIEVAGGLHIIN